MTSTQTGNEGCLRGARSTAPVFVLGSPRSGTTLLYDMLLSAGGFAVYLAESNVFNLLGPRFGDLTRRENRQRLLDAWFDSKLYRASGLDPAVIRKKVLDGDSCRHPGDFLRIVMDEITQAQGMQRWAENSPVGLVLLPKIKEWIPDALILHIVRDGRDVASSLAKARYVRPFPLEDRQSVIGAAVYWEWMVERGRAHGRMLGKDYMELSFEQLLAAPQETLSAVGRFIDHELDYERIRQVAYGSVSKPNTSFKAHSSGSEFQPVGRWKKNYSEPELARLEALIGPALEGLGYALATPAARRKATSGMKTARLLRRGYFESKLWLKSQQWTHRLLPELTGADIDKVVLAEDQPPKLVPALDTRGSRQLIYSEPGSVATLS
jgi:hypothetical protein